MCFSDNKRAILGKRKEKGLLTFLLALGIAATFFIPYIIKDSGYFIFYGDFNAQQIPFYKHCHQMIRSGGFFWDFKTDLGVNFIGSYAFYLLGSPFFWVTLLFPNSFVPYLMGPLFIIKFACAALTAYFYIRRFTRTSDAACLGGLLYAFSGFSIYNIFFNHFHEAIIVFPLLLLAFELLITENKRFSFALMVCISAVVNYFFFFGMVVFIVIYYIVRVCAKAVKFSFGNFLIICFEAVLGLLLSAIILLPAIMAITGNYRVSEILMGWNAIMYGKEQIYGNIIQCFFFPPDIPARPVFFPGAEVKWSSLGGWLPLFSMVGVFTFFSQRKNHWLKRMIGICTFMALVPILNSTFYAFNTSYYARWFYMPILLMCLATVTLTEDSEVDWSFGYKWVLGITLAIAVVIGVFPQKNSEDKIILGLYSQSDDGMYVIRFLITCLIAVVGLIILKAILKLLKDNLKSFYKAAIICVSILSIIYANVYIICGKSHSFLEKEVVIDRLIEGNVTIDDESEFRIDVYDGHDNTGMYLNYQTINAFHSIVPSSVYEFYDFVGVKRDVASRPDTDQEALRPLLSVKYLLNSTDRESFIDEETREPKMPGYSYLDSNGGYYIYKNDNYIPYGFSYKYYMDYEFCEDYSASQRAQLMLKAILLDDEQIKKYGHLLNNIEDISKNVAEDSSVTLAMTDYTLKTDSEELARTSADYFKIWKNQFEARVERQKENLVFFSVPYDEGWSATVNGKGAEIIKANVGFMAVKVEAGVSDIEFTYQTPYLLEGIKISTISALILIIYIIAFFVYSKKNNKPMIYPEGEEMLNAWRKQEIIQKNLEADVIPKKPSLLDNVTELHKEPKTDFSGGFKVETDIFDKEK